MRVHPHYSLDELHYLTKIEKNPYVRTRLHAVTLAQENKSAEEIASLLGYTSRIIFKWVKNYNLKGKEGLVDQPGRGKHPIFFGDEEAKSRFIERLQAGPTEGRSVFHGKDIQEILKTEFGVVRCLSDIYYFLHSLGYEWLCPRPKHPFANKEAQEEFKKKSLKKLLKLRHSILKKES